MADVFISYCHEERPRVLPIAERLKELGLDVWFDAKLHTGFDFTEEIVEELKIAKAILVCWSPAATNSKWVKSEAQVGLDQNTIAPCFVEPCSLWPPFNHIQTESLADWRGEWDHDGFRKLVARLSALVDRPGLQSLCAAHADTSGSKLASWAAAFPDDPAATSIWAIWEQRQRDDFKRATSEVRQTLADMVRQRQKRTETKLVDMERDFEAWLERRAGAANHCKPDPRALLRLPPEESNRAAVRDAERPLVPAAKRNVAPVAAALGVGLIVGCGLVWLVIKPTTAIAAKNADLTNAKIVQLETKLSETTDRAALTTRTLQERLSAAATEASAAKSHHEETERLLEGIKKKNADLEGKVQKSLADASSAENARRTAELELSQAHSRVGDLAHQLRAVLQTRAHAAILTYYRLHQHDGGVRPPALKDLYPEKFLRGGFPVDRDEHLKELSSYYDDYASFDIQPIDSTLDYESCVDEHSCLIRGSAKVTWKKRGQERPRSTSMKFVLRFDLGDPIKVLSECSNVSSADLKCD